MHKCRRRGAIDRFDLRMRNLVTSDQIRIPVADGAGKRTNGTPGAACLGSLEGRRTQTDGLVPAWPPSAARIGRFTQMGVSRCPPSSGSGWERGHGSVRSSWYAIDGFIARRASIMARCWSSIDTLQRCKCVEMSKASSFLCATGAKGARLLKVCPPL